MKDINNLLSKCRNSSFNKHGYSVTINIRNKERFIESLKLYTDYENKETKITTKDFFDKAIPGFQRENNKWSKNMQIKFVENVLQGFRTDIKLFRMSEQGDAQVIDGLQRLTAIFKFLDNKLKVFGEYTFSDISQNINSFPCSFTVSIYTFQDWKEVLKYYVDMNENITHSKEDIDKAKKWFKEEKGIELDKIQEITSNSIELTN